jgi:tetratricopeptide (TPR) repeat protein
MRKQASGRRRTTTEEYNMVGVVILGVIVLCISGIVWMRRRRWQAYATPVSPGAIPRETLALKAFIQGNSYLVEGKFTEALAAFHQARELDPKRPYVADRLAEAERRQQAASPTPLVNVTV